MLTMAPNSRGSLSGVTTADGPYILGYGPDHRASLRPCVSSESLWAAEGPCPVTGLPFVYLWPLEQRRCNCDLCGKAVCMAATTTAHPLAPKGMRVCRRCANTTVPQACGLYLCGWYHGNITKAEAEKRLSTEHSSIGDYMIRMKDPADPGSHIYVISVRAAPRHVRHIALLGGPGEWGTRATESQPTLQALIEAHHRKDDLMDRAAIVEVDEDMEVVCPTCNFSAAQDEFCANCGARVRSSEISLDQYHTIGREYLQMDTMA